MKAKTNGAAKALEIGKYIVADPKICHGKPTYKGTRIMVWRILEALGDGESVNELVKVWDGRVSRDAISETIRLAGTNLFNGHGRLRHGRASRLGA